MAAGEPESSRETLRTFEEGWPFLQEGVNKVIDTIEGVHQHQFTSEEYMRLYTIVYNVCCPNQCGPEARKMYQQYKKIFEDYISSKVLPSLREKKGENLLKELMKRWENHKVMTKWLSRFFHYLNRYLVPRLKLLTLLGVSHSIFYELVYGEMNDQVRGEVISMIDREREGEEIDQNLVKNVLNIYVAIAEDSDKYIEQDFEEEMLKNTATFYSSKASNWILSDSYEDYMRKVEKSLQHERDVVSCYLKFRSQITLLEVVEHELITVHASKLEDKKKCDDKSSTM